ncbi:SRPBCC family protein [Rhodococcus sp. Z13]|uniref:SRPBCC family protein n=1 Tax=Rhodococcus sacchari TaxID=2962047 RepID=A0ACD4DHT7_9NOCA|nr:SRPBCC family protein [Rhodococcus sp. Z13]UYP19572.1 SRPBCC family protein [Rhodococcus sp. Z13]
MNTRARFVDVDGRPAIQFEKQCPHQPERLWRALTDPADLARWFPCRVDIEPREDGTVTFTDEPGAEPTTGTVLACEPAQRLAYTWEGDELWFTLSPSGQGSVLVFANVLGDRETAAMVAAGWTTCLDELDALLAGGNPRIPKGAGREPIEEYIAAMPEWKHDIGRRLDELDEERFRSRVRRAAALPGEKM